MKSFYLLFLISFCAALYADERQIYAYTLDYRLDEAGTGHYNILLENMQKEGLHFNLLARPLKRAIRYFEEDFNSCIFPTSINALKTTFPDLPTDKMIASTPIDRVSLRIFTLPDKPIIQKLQDLEGKKVALWNGLDPGIFLKDINVDVENTPNEEVRVRMLNANRIDAILGFVPDVYLASEKLGLKPPHASKEISLFNDEGASLVCFNTSDNQLFISEFNSILDELKKSGKLREILGPYANIVGIDRAD